MTTPYVSVVVPAYNEEGRLGASLSAILSYMSARGVNAEVIVVDDGSTDKTPELVEALAIIEPRVRLIRFAVNRGKGAAVREGALAASGRLVLITDADLSTPIAEFDHLLARMRETSSDLVIGSRALDASRVEVRQPFWRQVMGKVFNRIVRVLTGLPYRDTQCGFKLLDRETTVPIFRKMVIEGFAFDVEMIWLSRLAGLRILEEPVSWKDSPDSRVSPVRSSWNMFLEMLRLRRRVRRGFYTERARKLGDL